MLNAAVDVYLGRRRAAGFQLVDQEGILRDFARFADTHGDDIVRTRTVLDWVRGRPVSPLRRAVRLRTVVHFARYLGAALFRRRSREVHVASESGMQELLDASKAWWGGRRGRLADRRCCLLSVSPGVIPLVFARFVEVPVRVEVAAGP